MQTSNRGHQSRRIAEYDDVGSPQTNTERAFPSGIVDIIIGPLARLVNASCKAVFVSILGAVTSFGSVLGLFCLLVGLFIESLYDCPTGSFTVSAIS